MEALDGDGTCSHCGAASTVSRFAVYRPVRVLGYLPFKAL